MAKKEISKDKKTLEFVPDKEQAVEMQKEIRGEEKVFKTYILMFKIEGHKTWRISMFQKKSDLEVYLSKQEKHPTIIEKKWFACERISGAITEEK